MNLVLWGVMAMWLTTVPEDAPVGATQAVKTARLPARPPAGLQGFSIVLVQGLSQTGSDTDLPKAAQTAIADMKDFLPFKSYQLMDSAWVLTESPSRGVNARLKGPDNVEYEVTVEVEPDAGATQRVQFRLREAAAKNDPRDIGQSGRELLTLQEALDTLQKKYTDTLRSARGEGNPQLEFIRSQLMEAERRYGEMSRRVAIDAQLQNSAVLERVNTLSARLTAERTRLQVLEAELGGLLHKYNPKHPDVLLRQTQADQARATVKTLTDELQVASKGPFVVAPPRAEPLINTTFTMRVGETVIVGTSRVRGDKALVAVLTAVPQSRGRSAF